jgi:hypothetical protein
MIESMTRVGSALERRQWFRLLNASMQYNNNIIADNVVIAIDSKQSSSSSSSSTRSAHWRPASVSSSLSHAVSSVLTNDVATIIRSKSSSYVCVFQNFSKQNESKKMLFGIVKKLNHLIKMIMMIIMSIVIVVTINQLPMINSFNLYPMFNLASFYSNQSKINKI